MSRTALPAAPHRPRAIRVCNAVLQRAWKRSGTSPSLRVDDLIAEARARTRLADFGDESFRPPLEVLVESIEREARVHPIGRLITRARLVGALATRLRVHQYVHRHPEVETIELEPPIVIAGLQRTGTTMLHRLLAVDPSLAAVPAWIGMSPVPGRTFLGRDPRRWKAHASVRALAYMAPEFFAIHPVEAEAPEEDVLLLDYTFLSTTPESTLHVPSQARWLEQQDHTPAYRYMALLLRMIAHGSGARRFVLKTPHHLEYLDVLRRVFPGVRVVQTHRDPTRTMASFCSMVWHGRGVFSDHVDAREVGAHWSRKIGRLLQRSMAVREAAGGGHFVDVSYYDLVRDPLATVSAMYEQLALAMTPDVEAAMRATRERNPQHKYGRHRYRLEDFGLSAASVEPLVSEYRRRFDVRREHAEDASICAGN